MRTIKFRGKRLDNGKWLYGDLMHDNVGGCYVYPIESEALFKANSVDPDTVGQFTGLTDKNGKEIYEGDVIGCHNPEIKHLIFYNEKQGRFMAALNGDIENDFIGVCGLDDRRWMASKDVIGNVHDNPELLKSL